MLSASAVAGSPSLAASEALRPGRGCFRKQESPLLMPTSFRSDIIPSASSLEHLNVHLSG
jgi:hypothetical protein